MTIGTLILGNQQKLEFHSLMLLGTTAILNVLVFKNIILVMTSSLYISRRDLSLDSLFAMLSLQFKFKSIQQPVQWEQQHNYGTPSQKTNFSNETVEMIKKITQKIPNTQHRKKMELDQVQLFSIDLINLNHLTNINILFQYNLHMNMDSQIFLLSTMLSYLLYKNYLQFNNFTMSKTDQKFRRFSNLEGYLQKKSSNPLAGFQMKYWRVVDNGSKIGYSHEKDDPIKAQNLFLIKQCLASELSGLVLFELVTRDKTILLKAPNQEQRIDWIKGLTYLKKMQLNPTKLKQNLSPTETTISRSQKKKTKKIQKPKTQQIIHIQKPKVYQPEDLSFDKQKQQQLIKQLVKYLPDKCLKYHTLLTNLKVKSQGLFMDSYSSHTYIMISPKSLYPDVYIGQQNLTNKSLPPWLEVNVFYKLTNNNQKKKQIFHVGKVIDTQQGSSTCSLKINTGQILYEFFTQTVEQKQCLSNCLLIGAINAQEVVIRGRISKRNFDKLVDLHEKNYGLFEIQAKKIVNSYLKDPEIHKCQPKTLFQFIEGSMIFLRQFIQVLDNKRKNKDHVILDMLKQFHEQIKLQTKLTWSTSYFDIKPTQILSMLKKLSEYYQIIKHYIKSSQFLDGMKQLSKIYVRESWKNFQSIIINVVEQQKRVNFQENQYSEYIQTHGITDLFKFIYNVYQLAAPHWKNKIHLHNVNRLMQRALQVFVNELRSTIDEQVIPYKQMVGLANNYFTFNQFVKDFYTQKFKEQLSGKTEEAYQKIIVSYRQVSSIILDKMAFNIGSQVEQYCQSCTIQTMKTDRIQQILINQTGFLQKILHMAFLKKLFDKISRQVHLKICHLLIDQVKSKKKVPLKLKQITKYVKDLRGNLNKVFDRVCKNHSEIDKRMGELDSIISVELYSDIEQIMQAGTQPTKSTYLKLLQLREDYFEGSALFRIINQSESIMIKKQQKLKPGDIIRQRNQTVSHQYFQEELMSNADPSQSKNQRISNIKQESKLISEGYLTKGKRNKKVFQKQYFRLKNGVLYIFQTADSQKCNNAIEIKNVTNLTIANPQKPSFLLTYKTLRKQKEVKLKAETIQIRQKWVYSLQLQRKRISNEEQVRKKNNLIYRESTNNAGNKKNQMIFDFQEAEKGKDYFSYTT